MRTWPAVDGGKEPQAKECGWPLKAGKGKDVDPPLEYLEEAQPP